MEEHKESKPQSKFGIYANNDMYIGHTLYKKGQLVMSIKTNDKGIAKSGNLPYGSYYVKEFNHFCMDIVFKCIM